MSSDQDAKKRRVRTPRQSRGRSRDEGGRRAEILNAAIDRFGRDGYENTRWADIADDVGIGPTGLYHYFDSKQHCLYVIFDQALDELHDRFDSVTAAQVDPRDALRVVCSDCFELSEREVLRNRVLVAEQVLLSGQSSSHREEQARLAGRERTRRLELAWTRFLADAMSQGAIPERDPRMLARAMLGLYNSIWHWYRPDQAVALPAVADFFIDRLLAVAGIPPEINQTIAAASDSEEGHGRALGISPSATQ
jgi:TetR/AcrR family transcriptional regulator, cholesterol catabolism regulator